jgi:hypothetical protein
MPFKMWCVVTFGCFISYLYGTYIGYKDGCDFTTRYWEGILKQSEENERNK